MSKRTTAGPLPPALFSSIAILSIAAGCSSGPTTPVVSPADRARILNESTLGGFSVSASGPQSSVALAEESAGKRLAHRRAVLKARDEQDKAFTNRTDDASFVEFYKTNDRDDSIKLYLYGRALGMVKQMEAAKLQFNAAAAADAKNPWPNEGLGVFHYQNKQYDQAIVHFKKASETDPDLAESYFGLSRTFQAMGRMPEAITAAESCIRCDEDPVRGPLLLVDLRFARNELDKAIAVLKTAIEKTPNNITLRLSLAEAYSKVGKYTEAAAEIDAAVANGKLPPDRLYRVAILYERAERFDRAIELMERLMKEAPADYWKSHSREDFDKIISTLREEQKLGHRLEYTAAELCTMVINHPDAGRRKQAAELLSTIPAVEADQTFIKALHDASAEVRMIAVIEVVKRTRELSVKAIAVIAARDRDEGVRATACVALAALDYKESLDALVGAITDPSQRVRVSANKSLEFLSGKILFPLGVDQMNDKEAKDAQVKWQQFLSERKTKFAPNTGDELAPPVQK